MCDGPLIWFSAGTPESGAVLECAARGCDYFIPTGGFHDTAHASADFIKEGLA